MGINKSNRVNAFSLIELMVVIAIIAVLAAIAGPAYKKYIITANLQKVASVMTAIMEKSKQIASVKGHFGNAYELGLRSDNVGNSFALDSTAIGQVPFLAPAYVGDSGIGVNTNNPVCGDYGDVFMILDAAALGFSSDVSGVYMSCDMWHYDGVVYSTCGHEYGLNADAESGTDELLPGWYNHNITNAWDETNSAIYVTNLPSFIGRTCQ